MTRRVQPYVFVLPALLVTLSLTIAPLLQLARASLRDWQLGSPLAEAPFVGADNYERLLTGSVTLGHALKLTFIYAAAALTIELGLGLVIALVVNRALRVGSVVTSVMLVPMILMPAIVAMVFRLYFSYEGLVNWLMGLVGVPPANWFSAGLAIPAVVIVDVWQWTPFFVLILVAGLETLPSEMLEAAEVDGATRLQLIRHVQLPIIAPLIVVASTLRVMELLRQFDVVFVMYGGGPGNATEILSMAVYRTTLQQRQAGAGAAFSIILIVLVTLVAGVFIRLMRRYEVDS